MDGRNVEVEPGQTVLDAARRLGIDIPTLCYLERCGPQTSCLVCLVKVISGPSSRLAPACGLPAQQGMIIESETAEVHEARRTALELIFSDHVGDCLAPCHRICPLELDIPVMLRQVEAGQLEQAVATVRTVLPLPAVLGRLCHHPCENGCRRGAHDQPIAIRDVERFVADHALANPPSHAPPAQPATGRSAAVVGAGPAGLATATFLRQQGIAVTVFDRHPDAGGSLRREIKAGTLPPEIVRGEIARLQSMGVAFRLGQELGRNLTLADLVGAFDAIVLALGESGKAQAEALGLTSSPRGIAVDPATSATAVPRVFATGAAVKPVPQIVRAMSDGRLTALDVVDHLAGRQPTPRRRPFSSVMGRLDPNELKSFLIGVSPASRVSPALELLRGFKPADAADESARCLHCDCRAAGHCRLERYAQVYGVDPGRFRSQRRLFVQDRRHGEILFEQGKCILCGICVKIAEAAREPLGLTFVGRGFDVRLSAPLDRTLADGLQRVARECVEACPTGALALRSPRAPATGCCPPRRAAGGPESGSTPCGGS